MITIYKDLITALAEEFDQFSTIELDRNQLNEEGGLQDLVLPACFVEFENDIDWEYDTSYIYAEDVEFTLNIGVDSNESDVLDFVDYVTKTLSDKYLKKGADTIMDSLSISRTSLDTSKDQIDIASVTFQTCIRLRKSDKTEIKKGLALKPTVTFKK